MQVSKRVRGPHFAHPWLIVVETSLAIFIPTTNVGLVDLNVGFVPISTIVFNGLAVVRSGRHNNLIYIIINFFFSMQ